MPSKGVVQDVIEVMIGACEEDELENIAGVGMDDLLLLLLLLDTGFEEVEELVVVVVVVVAVIMVVVTTVVNPDVEDGDALT